MPVNGIRLLAHRGSRLTAPENTLEAVSIARDEGADGIELDVQLSADGEPFIFHDDNAQRLTGENLLVARTPWRELRKLKVLGKHRIPHLDEVLRAVEDWKGAELTIDLHQDSLKLAEVAARRIGECPARERICVLDFYWNRKLVLHARQVDPRVRIALMPGYPWKTQACVDLKAVELCLGWDGPLNWHLYRLGCLFYDIKRRIRGAQAAGVKVSGGVANSPKEVLYMLDQGADGIWTDDLPMARKVLETWKPSSGAGGS